MISSFDTVPAPNLKNRFRWLAYSEMAKFEKIISLKLVVQIETLNVHLFEDNV